MDENDTGCQGMRGAIKKGGKRKRGTARGKYLHRGGEHRGEYTSNTGEESAGVKILLAQGRRHN